MKIENQMMKLKYRYERPETWNVSVSPLLQSYDPNDESGLIGINMSGQKMDASMGESNQSGWDDEDNTITPKSLWDD